MEFVKGICPECHGELSIPGDRDKIICMYCGKEIERYTAVSLLESKDAGITVSEEECEKALDNLLFGMENPLEYFKKNLYLDFFKKYMYEQAVNLNTLKQAYNTSEDKDTLISEASEYIAAKADEMVNGARRGKKRDDVQMDLNLTLVVYAFPAMLEYDKLSAEAWTKGISAAWKKHFPKYDLGASDYETINKGFKYRFCFITTAVCKQLGKPDDCYELELFRGYRDSYLAEIPGGQDFIEEYYDIAPTIVKRIDSKANSQSIYEGIWENYLSECISMIEESKNEECCELYKKMVYDLKDEYFYE